jgi:exonuclease III
VIERILAEDSDIVCLQEFWVENEEMIALYQEKLGHRYQWNQLRRTGGRGDGLVFVYTCIHTYVCVCACCVRARAHLRVCV